jgi:hypothetical protein
VTAWLNPFHVLGVSVDASREEIIARAAELAGTCGSGEERTLVAWAENELTTDPLLRARYERTEPRGTDYGRRQRFEDFVREYTPNPVTAARLTGEEAGKAGEEDGDGAGLLRAEDVDLPAAVRILIREAADAGLDALDPLFQTLPVNDDDGVSRLEIRDVLFG